jgi:putative oxidoreductase
MNIIHSSYQRYQQWRDAILRFDGIPALLLRLYLAPVMMQAGWNKYQHFSDTVEWFGNTEWGLGLPFPAVFTTLAILAELLGAILLLAGAMTRLVTLPLMMTMLVAITTVHWPYGWLAIADASSWLADGTIFSNASVQAAPEKLAAANAILQQHGNYEWLTSSGKLVILNNGIEFAATYFLLLLALFFIGGGRYVSVDDWLKRRLNEPVNRSSS